MRRGFLIDMDGVIYRGNEIIPGADEFIRALQRHWIPFLFLTNNSQRTRRDVMTKLLRMGINVEEKNIFTCAMATARFLAKQKPNGTAYVIGEGGLLQALHLNGFSIVDHEPDFVVVGEGRTLTLDTLERGVNMILGGAKLIAINLDPNCPTQHGTRPGCGATVAYLECATGMQAFSMGKPSPIMMQAARKELNLKTSETIIIGDTMETDILGGVQMGYQTILTLTGSTSLDDLSGLPTRRIRLFPRLLNCEIRCSLSKRDCHRAILRRTRFTISMLGATNMHWLVKNNNDCNTSEYWSKN